MIVCGGAIWSILSPEVRLLCLVYESQMGILKHGVDVVGRGR